MHSSTTAHAPAVWSTRLAPPRRVMTFVSLLLAYAMTLSVAHPASAQEILNSLPNPISSSELIGYMGRLGLSEPQQLAVESMHDQYKQEYRQLRERLAADYNKRFGEVNQQMPALEDVEAMLKMLDRLRDRVRIVDNRFFDQAATIFIDEQLVRLERVRMARQRVRDLSMEFTSFAGRGPVDVSDVVYKLDLDSVTRKQVDPILETYERRLTRDIAELFKRNTTVIRDVIRELERLGIDPSAAGDVESQQKSQEVAQQLMIERMAESQKIMRNIQENNARTFKRVRELLPDDIARRFRSNYYMNAYPLYRHLIVRADHLDVQDLDALDELSDEQRTDLASQISALYDRIDAMVDRLVETSDELDALRGPFGDQSNSEVLELQDTLSQRTLEISQQQSELATTIAQMFSEQQWEQLNVAKQKRMAEARDQYQLPGAVVALASGDIISEQEVSQTVWGPDMFLPREITATDVRLYANVIGADEQQRAVLDAALAGYRERYEQFRDRDISGLYDLQRSMWIYDEQTGAFVGLDESKLDDTDKKRQSLFTEQLRVDASYFDEVQAGLPGVEPALLNRIRQLRQRDAYNRGQYQFVQGSMEHTIDLVKLFYRTRRSPEDRAAAHEALLAYESAMSELFERRYRVARELHMATERGNSMMMRSQRQNLTVTESTELWMRYQDNIRPVQDKLNKANAAVGAVNDTHHELVAAALSDEAGRRFTDTYKRLAFPQVFMDRHSPLTALERAYKLESLTSNQRGTIENLLIDYRYEYESLCEHMIQLHRQEQLTGYAGVVMEDAAKQRSIRQRLENLHFDRSEINSRTTRRLRATLRAEQIAAIGGLPPLPE